MNVLLLLVIALPVPEPAAVTIRSRAGVEPALLAAAHQAGPGEKLGVIIALRRLPDWHAAVFFTRDRSELRRVAAQALSDFARPSQAALLAELDAMAAHGLVDSIMPLWIVNAIYCRATGAAIERIAARPEVWFVGHDRVPAAVGTRLEPALAEHEDDIAWNVRKVKADSVWHRYGLLGEGVVVGHIDGGCDYTHPDLAGHMWTDSLYPNHGWNFAQENEFPMDTNGHGTHTAGTVAGDGTSGTATGMAPRSQIMICRVKTLYSQPGPDTICENTILRAMEFCIAPPLSPNNGADLITMSMGLHHSWSPRRALFRQAVTNVAAAGLPFFIAAGNDGKGQPPHNVTTPADVPGPWKHPSEAPGGLGGAITVGATDVQDAVADFSSRGPSSWSGIAPYNDYPYPPGLLRPDFVAPGVGVTSCRNGGGYYASSGTSMAAPCAAGVCALMFEKNPDLTPRQVDSILQTSVEPLAPAPKTDTVGTGRINALLAVEQTRYGAPHHDIAVVRTLAPGAMVNQREPVAPRIIVANRGTFRETGVTFCCRVESSGVAVYERSVGLPFIDSVSSDTVTFPDWNVGPGFQNYSLTFWHHHRPDTSAYNDTLRAITTSRGHDVGISYTSFRPRLLAARKTTPIAYLENAGDYVESGFRAYCRVDSSGVTVFRDSAVAESVPLSGRCRVRFAEWTTGPVGAVYDAVVWHDLGSDERRASDTVRVRSTTSDRLVALVIYSDHAAPESLAAGLRGFGDSVRLYDAHDQTPLLADLLPFDAVGAFDNFTFLDPFALGDTLAEYADRGGGVVIGDFCFTTGWRMQGRIMAGAHATLVPGAANFRLDSIGIRNEAHPIMSGVGQVADYFRASATHTAGAEPVARWADGRPFVAVSPSLKVVALNQYPGAAARSSERTGDWVRVWRNALHYSASSVPAAVQEPAPVAIVARLAVAPSPARGAVVFNCRLSAGSPAELAICDLSGRVVRRLAFADDSGGVLRWQLDDDAGRRVAAGIYFCRLSSGGVSETRKLVIR